MSQAGIEQKAVNFEWQVRQHNAAQDTLNENDAPDLQSVISTAELSRRPARPPDYAAENRALIALAQEMAASPEAILQKLADTALSLCHAHSAGLSILEEGDQKRSFHWRAIAGQWAPHLNGGTPRNFGPCGTVLDRNVALLFSHPERDFPYFGEVRPLLEEGLLIPFYVKGEAIGTIWVVTHDEGRRFDTEDLRVMTSLGTFASTAYQTLLSLNATQKNASIVDSSDDAIISKDLNGVISSWNRGAEQLFGYAADEVIGKPVSILIPPERHDEESTILERIRRGERIEHYETVRMCKHGKRLNISVTVSPIRNVEGKVIGASKIARNITDRKKAEDRINLLAREMDHRAKNVLALVQATVRLTKAETPEGVKSAIAGRIQAIANAHTLFAQSRWEGADLRTLVMEELAPYRKVRESLAEVKGPDLMLEPTTAQSMTVALHELTTNAVKYGALSVENGHVEIEWSHAADGQFTFRWSETGGPPIHAPTRHGFGTRVIEKLIKAQLNGEVRFDWSGKGLVCEIVIRELPKRGKH